MVAIVKHFFFDAQKKKVKNLNSQKKSVVLSPLRSKNTPNEFLSYL